MSSSVHSGFLQGPNGPLHVAIFTRDFSASSGEQSAHWVVHVPAFGEEMNKCRPMVARQARRLATEGAVVIVPDLFGTGDSAGEFADASWSHWLADLDFLRSWCLQQGAGAVSLWGVRLGCLLALESLCANPADVSGVLLWQPVLAGAPHLNQFLRLRTASGMMQGQSESVSDLRQHLADGRSLEVAGYLLSPALYDGITAASITGLSLPAGCSLSLYEVVGEAGKSLMPVTAKHVHSWRESSVCCHADTVQGSPFWLTQEIGFAPALLDAGSDFLHTLAVPAGSALHPQGQLLAAIPQGDCGSVAGMTFSCGDEQLVGQLHKPTQCGDTGVLIVVGGPQYRVGSHRQFQQLATQLCDGGLAAMRFDYRGMGDSSGELHGFTAVGEDIRSAVDAFLEACPEVRQVVLWGLCDAATASVFYAQGDSRVCGMVLANPWVYSVQGEAKAFLKHYYRDRLFSRDLWRKVIRGDFDLRASLASVLGFLRNAKGGSDSGQAETVLADNVGANSVGATGKQEGSEGENVDLVAAVALGLERFSGASLFIISGNDLTAAEFMDAARDSAALRACLQGVNAHTLELGEADHTFSHQSDSVRVEEATLEFVRSLS